jgi:hypothetical protein
MPQRLVKLRQVGPAVPAGSTIAKPLNAATRAPDAQMRLRRPHGKERHVPLIPRSSHQARDFEAILAGASERTEMPRLRSAVQIVSRAGRRAPPDGPPLRASASPLRANLVEGPEDLEMSCVPFVCHVDSIRRRCRRAAAILFAHSRFTTPQIVFP